MTSRDHDKANRYIAALDAARARDSWSEVPELVRKVTKHAPNRKCLIQTATAEHRVVTYAASRRPASSSSSSDISQLIPSLSSTVNNEPALSADTYQAQTCLGWVHWVLSEPGLTIATLPKDIATALRDTRPMTEWTEICLIKAAYMKGTAQGQGGNVIEAQQTFQLATPWIEQFIAKVLGQPQLLYWSEQLLAQAAFYASKDIDFASTSSADRVELSLRTYRLWANLATKSNEISLPSLGNKSAHCFRVHVFKAYYDFLSQLLRQHADDASTHEGYVRVQQSTELQNVERMYESELLRSSRFPKAQESNAPIEEWVEQVIQNWELMCGPSWREADLGEGGHNSLGRNVLDILYRAASKTFHSTLILRRLFQVHKSLTDFDLAYKALDTYIELIERGRARAEKSNELPVGQDSDEVVLRTISEGIEGLCTFGFRDEAEKAFELANKIAEWVQQPTPAAIGETPVNGHTENRSDGSLHSQNSLGAETLETVHRAIGISRAQWAKWNPVTEDRTRLQSEAMTHLETAIAQKSCDEHHLESIYALSLLLAETRDINGALEYVKKALSSDSAFTAQNTNFETERRLLPLWHLLGLLLTARQDFETAGQTCSAAFAQFPSSTVLFGARKKRSPSYFVSEKERPFEQEEMGLVDDMEARELVRIIEIRITELALTEVVEGPEEAVNLADDLLSLFSRLFGRFGVATNDRPTQKPLDPPKSSAGTVKSFRGSIFGRRRQIRQGLPDVEQVNGISTIPEKEPLRLPTRASNAPTIQVTDEDNNGHHFKLHNPLHAKSVHREDHSSQKLHKRGGSINQKTGEHSEDRTAGQDRSFEIGLTQPFETSQKTSDQGIVSNTGGSNDTTQTPTALGQIHGSSSEAKQVPSPVGHNQSNNDLPPPIDHHNQPPDQDVRLPTVARNTSTIQPVSRFSRATSQRQGLIILVRIWLLIASLYRRALMFDDSREACDEADKTAMRFETIVATQESSARAFADAGWGGSMSSDELWADVLCEKATLAVAKADVPLAIEQYEQALMFWPNHTKATVGLSNILLDTFEQKGAKEDISELRPKSAGSKRKEKSTDTTNGSQNGAVIESGPMATTIRRSGEELRKTPENLNRLAARDRAYGLLSNLTKLGTGWDDSEAWFALARAHELGGQLEKAKEVLWWCVELEDRRPVRHWRNVNGGSYVL